ncbi:hypothetical protein V6Z11_A11G251100 [Gossypium hirsutum]
MWIRLRLPHSYWQTLLFLVFYLWCNSCVSNGNTSLKTGSTLESKFVLSIAPLCHVGVHRQVELRADNKISLLTSMAFPAIKHGWRREVNRRIILITQFI